MTPQSHTAVATERLKEILAGCEGVTPGPWTAELHSDPQWAIRGPGKFQFIATTTQGNDQANAAHLTRLDPQTVAAIVSELLALRSPLQDSQEHIGWLVHGAHAKVPEYPTYVTVTIVERDRVYIAYPGKGMARWYPIEQVQPWGDYRDALGRAVRLAWVAWAKTQPNPKSSWLVDYDDLSECDKEADRQIGEAIAQFSWPTEPTPSPRIVEPEARIAELEGLVERVNERALDDISDITMRAEAAESALSTAEARGLEIAAKIVDRAVAVMRDENSKSRGTSFKAGAIMIDGLVGVAAAIRALSTNEAGE